MALPTKARVSSAVLLLAAAAAAVLHLDRPASSAALQSTDDAYVQADFTTVAAQVSGTIDRVFIDDNQSVRAGELLASIDARDFAVALAAAEALVAGAQASSARLEAQLRQQDAVILQAQAAVAADDAALTLARENAQRYRNLAADGSGSVQALQQAEAELRLQLAGRDRSAAGLQFARQQLDVLNAELAQARAVLAQAQAAVAAAALTLSHTRITAPVDGTIGQKVARVGAFVSAGKPLLVLVPLDAVYIMANYRETQVARIRPGQAVTIDVDALPGVVLQGTVESLGPASGASYSALAPHNATGNFTKIVQRLPVRIRIDPGQPAAGRLRVGMSVTPAIRIVE